MITSSYQSIIPRTYSFSPKGILGDIIFSNMLYFNDVFLLCVASGLLTQSTRDDYLFFLLLNLPLCTILFDSISLLSPSRVASLFPVYIQKCNVLKSPTIISLLLKAFSKSEYIFPPLANYCSVTVSSLLVCLLEIMLPVIRHPVISFFLLCLCNHIAYT